MTFADDEPKNFYNFLSKFNILDEIHWDEWALDYAITQVCWDIAREHIDYAELKFSVDRYSQSLGWPNQRVVKFIHDIIERECDKWGMYIALVLSLKYSTDKERQRQIAKLIETDAADCIVGIDLVGDEGVFTPDFYVPIFREWKKAGKGLEAHVGESQSAENVRIAIEKLGVHRVAHGIKAADYPDILALAKERNVCFDTALTSNLFTGVVPSLREHPAKRLINQGVAVTIGTDDPAILGTDLDKEYSLLQTTFKLSDEQIIDVMYNSYLYAFPSILKSMDSLQVSL
jgi:adenosine deaminase